METLKKLRIATRKSPLALWQAEEVARRLHHIHAGLEVELVSMSTKGDRVLDSPLAKIGGKGLFVKELEQGLLAGKADIAVHSMKDVPLDFPAGLTLAVVLKREDPRDAFLAQGYGQLSDLPAGARVGTSSLRRQCQIRELHPELKIRDLRGNVNTRLAKLDAGAYEAIILAAAGLKRLGLGHRITSLLGVSESLPAIGQGIIGIECREDDAAVMALISPLDHSPSSIRVRSERALNRRLGGGCQVPLAGYAELEGDRIHMRGLVGLPDGTRILRSEAEGPADSPEEIGLAIAESLLAQGAGDILATLGITVVPLD